MTDEQRRSSGCSGGELSRISRTGHEDATITENETSQDDGRTDERAFAVRLARLADELKGENVVILDVLEELEIVDFFVIVTGLNERHIRAMAEEIDLRVKKEDERLKNHAEGLKNERWVLLDYGSTVVHLFHPEAREYYDLEFLRAGAPRVEWGEGTGDGPPG